MSPTSRRTKLPAMPLLALPVLALTGACGGAHVGHAGHGQEASCGHHAANAADGAGAAPTGAADHHSQGHPHKAEGIHHRFDDPERWAKVFDDPSRDAWQKPSAVLEELALQPNAIVMDLGAGTGYFAVRLARQVPQGRVYAADIEPNLINYLTKRAAKEGLPNLTALLIGAAAPMLPEPADLILVVDTYHHLADRPAYVAKLRQGLNPGGRLVIVDFRQGENPVGPPEKMRVPPAQVAAELSAAGLTKQRLLESLLPYQYLLEASAP